MKATDPPIIATEEFNISKSKLWQVITEVDHMHKWFFDNIPAFNPVVGFETAFMVSTPDREFLHTWKLTEVILEEKIVYDWSYEGYEGRGLVAFEITGDNTNSKIKLTSTTTEDWAQDIPEFTRESAIGGWTYFINQQLKGYIESL